MNRGHARGRVASSQVAQKLRRFPPRTAMPRFDRRLRRSNAEGAEVRRDSQRVLLLCVSLRFLCVSALRMVPSVAAPPRCTAIPRFDRRLRRFNAEGAEVRRDSQRVLLLCVSPRFLCVSALKLVSLWLRLRRAASRRSRCGRGQPVRITGIKAICYIPGVSIYQPAFSRGGLSSAGGEECPMPLGFDTLSSLRDKGLARI